MEFAMRDKIRRILPGVILFAFLMVGLASFNLVNAKIHNFHLIQNGFVKAATIPIKQDFDKGEKFSVEFELESSFEEIPMRIVPDDCVDSIVVNGRRKSLAGIDGLCSFTKGFDFSAEPGFYHVYLHNNGGAGGFEVVLKNVFIQKILYAVNTLLLLALLGWLICKFKILPFHLMLMLLVAVGLHCAYTYNTNYMTRSYDTEGHVAYVKYIAENHSIPNDEECWSCYHPPIYYVAGAFVWTLTSQLGLVETRALQWFSFSLSIILMIVGVKILMLLLNGAPLVLASSLWLFWPVLFMISPRVGNDQLFFLAHVLCLWWCLKYILNKDGRCMILAGFMVALSFWTKNTGAVTALVFISAFVLGYFPRQSLKPSKSEMTAIVVFIAFTFSVVLDKLFLDSALVGNLNSLNSLMRVNSDVQNILFFDIKEFLTIPYTSGWHDEGGRQYMLNYLAKTSMFGETVLDDSVAGRNLAASMSFLLLGIVITAFVGFLKTKISKAYLLLVLQAVYFFIALAALRIKAPYGCSSDFRYVVPVLLSFVPFVGLGTFCKEGTLGWKCTGVVFSVLFVICTIWLMMLL